MATPSMDEFEALRARLFGLAYRMLGEAGEAEDVVQDAYLRWAGAAHTEIAYVPAWLTKVVTNLCLNRLTSARARRETYIGPWLPEPVLTADGALGPLDTVEQLAPPGLGVFLAEVNAGPAILGFDGDELHLLDAGRQVRVFSCGHRHTGRAHHVTGDVRTGEGLDEALVGVGTIVACVDPAHRVVEAALRAGKPHLVYISIVGVDRVPLDTTSAKPPMNA